MGEVPAWVVRGWPLGSARGFARFPNEDSGCPAWGVEAEGARWFVKTSEDPAGVKTLRQAAALHGAVRHRSLVPLRWSRFEGGRGVLVYPWVEGVSLYDVEARAAFLGLPRARRVAAVDELVDAHARIAAAGFVSSDLYEGALLWDEAGDRLWLIDVDEYRPGPCRVEGECAPGSTRWMAPEEWVSGGRLDARTTVFHLGRAGSLLKVGTSAARRRVLERAQREDPAERFGTVEAYRAAWRETLEVVRRPMREEDLPALREVHTAAFRTLIEGRFAFDAGLQGEALLRGLDVAEVLEIEGELAGQLVVRETAEEVDVERIMVHPRWQGRGLGTRLLREVRARAGARPVTLQVWEENRARGWYAREGFREVGQEGFRVQMRAEGGSLD